MPVARACRMTMAAWPSRLIPSSMMTGALEPATFAPTASAMTVMISRDPTSSAHNHKPRTGIWPHSAPFLDSSRIIRPCSSPIVTAIRPLITRQMTSAAST